MKFYLINNTSWQVSEGFFKWLLQSLCRDPSLLKKHKLDFKKTMGFVLVSSPEMKKLNFRYRRKKKITDVLSFHGDGMFLGDVVLCVPQIRRQARDHQLDMAEELAYLALHGVLHLLGYEHETSPQKAKKMFQIQDKLFAELLDRDIVKIFKKTGKHGKKA